ncbi:uncharacterized Golgi apparatus membrane protein-like protein CG5021 [Daphnia pulicaria]|uniref:uncharacterized Golgi apparatus membrane protein-like protein CG5021 n=1 Tax=Daphnia pulicaria TaxID=35523 RepID=UPI001EEBE63C|nr:uncharacterized Golgi apparatus membrane protein-like protein CG5021 [Daphnia pulicaria]
MSTSATMASSAANAALIDDDTPGFGEEENPKQFRHPYVVFFHFGFRVAALLVYLFCGWFSDGFVTSFVFTVILLSLDFWTVKNITGRILVGLRWWSYVDGEGKSHWVYEARKEGDVRKVHAAESRVFWIGLIVFPLVWSILFILAIFRFSFRWLVLDCIALSLNGANVYGYLRCKLGKGTNLTGAVSNYANGFFRQQVMDKAVNMLTRQAQTSNVNSATNII